MVQFDMSLISAFAVMSLASSAVTSTATAVMTLGVDLSLGNARGNMSNYIPLGFGVGGRVGFRLPIPVVTLVPEALVDYSTFGSYSYHRFEEDLGDPSMVIAPTSIWRFMAGARAGIPADIFTLSMYFHLGYGSASGSTRAGQRDPPGGPPLVFSTSQKGLALNFGGAVDFPLLHMVAMGAHVGYNQVSGDFTSIQNGVRYSSPRDSTQWIDFGVHTSLSF